MVSGVGRAGAAPGEARGSGDPGLATLLLQLLSGDLRARPSPEEWPALQVLARRTRVMLRLEARLRGHPEQPPTVFTDAVAEERRRSEGVLAVAARIGATCERTGVPHVFLTAAWQYPDVGADLDMLVPAASASEDAALLDHLPAVPAYRTPLDRLARRRRYVLPGHTTTLTVYHGRLGLLGEHTRYADLLLRRRYATRLGAARCSVPSPDDQLLYQALSRVPFRRRLSLSDVAWGFACLLRGVRWETLVPAASATGLLAPLACYLEYLDQIHREVFGRPLLGFEARSNVPRRVWGRVAYRRGDYRLPLPDLLGPLCLGQLRLDLCGGDWAAAARLLFAPLVGLEAGWRRLAHRTTGGN